MSRTCPGCEQPMLDGQVFNGLLGCHWDCSDKTREVMGEQQAKALEQARVDSSLRANGLSPSDPTWKRLGGSV